MALPAWITRRATVSVEQIDLAQPAVPPEHVGEALVGREDDRGMREVAEAGDAADGGALGPVHDQERPAGALHHHPEIAGGADIPGCGRQGEREQERDEADHGAAPSSRYSAIHAASRLGEQRAARAASPSRACRRGSRRRAPPRADRPAPRDGCRARGRRRASARGRSRSPGSRDARARPRAPRSARRAKAGPASSSSARQALTHGAARGSRRAGHRRSIRAGRARPPGR